MKKILKEFKEFAIKGNMIDMAVGIIIGGAFTSVVSSLVSNVFMPLIGIFTGGVDLSTCLVLKVRDAEINFGLFITNVIDFLIMAFVVFIFVKLVNRLRQEKDKNKAPEAPKAPTTKICPYCKSEIDINATRCPHCTSELK